MAGAFIVFRDKDDSSDIHFQMIDLKENEKIPDEQLAFRDEVDRCLTTIKLLFQSNEKSFERYFRPLLSVAQLGLVGPTANPTLATRALMSLQNDIVASEGGRIKNGYMQTLGRFALAFGLPAILLFQLISVLDILSFLRPFLLLWAACMAGVWLSFGARKIAIQFSELAVMESDRLNPPMRLAYAGMMTMAIGLLLSKEFLVLESGKFTSKLLSTDVQVALIIGMFCGICELALSSKLVKSANDFLGLK